jgi:hypothetical protein
MPLSFDLFEEEEQEEREKFLPEPSFGERFAWAITHLSRKKLLLLAFVIVLLLTGGIVYKFSRSFNIGAQVLQTTTSTPSSLTPGGVFLPPTKIPTNRFMVPETTRYQIIGGWLVPWEVNSFNSFQNNVAIIGEIYPFWYEIGTDGVTIDRKYASLVIDQAKYLAKARNVRILPTISADPDLISQTLSDSFKRGQHVINIVNLVTINGYDGIDIDYEGLSDKSSFNLFTQDLATALHKEGKLLSITVQGATSVSEITLDWQTIGKYSDRVKIMGYDYHSRITDNPGPIGPKGWLSAILNWATSQISPTKIIIALGAYGYDWQKESTGGWTGSGLTYQGAIDLQTRYSAKLERTTGTDDRGYQLGSTPHFSFIDGDSKEHQVYFEDTLSISEKLDLINQYKIGGMVLWYLGAEDPRVWEEIQKKLK